MEYVDVVRRYLPSRPEVAVTVSGIVSMALEIVAGRVLAPAFGSTIYTWGSIIGISLLALSIGYWKGGKRASSIGLRDLDRYLVMAAIYILALIVIGDEILVFTSMLPVPPRFAAILPVTLLFGPPTYFLGFISPYAVQLSGKQGKGEASGHFYAVGTAGSLIGAFGATFFLIPYFSVNTMYVLFVGLLLLPLIRGWTHPKTYFLPLCVVLGVVLSSSTPLPGDTVYQTTTPYQELRVVEESGIRTLYLDGQPQSAMYIDGRDGYPWTYPRYFHVPFLLTEDIEDVLFIGGGGFSGPKRFAAKNISVDVVELDPEVIRVAKEYFGVEESEYLEVYNADGRAYLQGTNKTYDVIYLDAYRKASVPFHLTTQEFMELTYQRTDDDGVVFSNTISVAEGPGSEFGRAQIKTLQTVYESTYYFPTTDTALAQNVEIIGTKQLGLTKEALQRRAAAYDEMNLTSEIGRLTTPNTDGVPVLTDSYAPVDTLLEPLIGQQYIVGSS